MKKLLLNLLKSFNYDVVKTGKNGEDPRYSDFDPVHFEIWDKVQHNTMTSKERIFGLIEGVKYISKYKIEGDVVECGVWKGGSMMATAETLLLTGDSKRQLYLYDTFEGMSEPSSDDQDVKGRTAKDLLSTGDKANNNVWAYSALDTVQQGMNTTKYPAANIHYVKGKVEDTIPNVMPDKIALLRLDTDWYESTKHELIHLFPRLQKGGILIIDDYGFWKGARKAVDEYFADNNIQILLSRMDNTGRIAIKN